MIAWFAPIVCVPPEVAVPSVTALPVDVTPSVPCGVDTVPSAIAPPVPTVPAPVSAFTDVAEIVVAACRSKDR